MGRVPLSARTCNRVMACVSSFYEYLITAERYRDRENPIVKQEDAASARVPARFRQPLMTSADQRPVRRVLRVRTTEPLPRPIPNDTYLAIIDQLRTLRDRALVELMWEGGFRPGEVLGLQLEDNLIWSAPHRDPLPGRSPAECAPEIAPRASRRSLGRAGPARTESLRDAGTTPRHRLPVRVPGRRPRYAARRPAQL